MILSQIKLQYFNQLKDIYPKTEIEGIFSIVIGRLLNYSKIDIHLNQNKKIDPSNEKKMILFLNRLITGEPVQYILGETEFCGLPLKVDRRVLIPRPETEYLADLAINFIPKNKSVKIIDLCTGSGCIAIALYKKLPLSEITAVDISADAIELARENSNFNKTPIKFLKDDLLNPSLSYDLYQYITCNPPYVRESERALMHKNVVDFEPALALFVKDSDPLIFYRALAKFGRNYLENRGCILAEINETLGDQTAQLFDACSYNEITVLKDLQNKDRYIRAMKNE